MNRFLTALASAAALWLAACSGGGSNVQPPPPTGKFTLASLNGTYAFITNGEVFNGATVNPLARVGSFTADGKGGISGGIEDVNTSGVGVTQAISITGGSYKMNADGRGTLTFNFASGNSTNFALVLTSGSNGSIASDGLMIDETSNLGGQSSTGSGNFILQNPGSFGSTIPGAAGAYVFDFAGLDSNQAPDSIIGQFTVNNGVVSSGVQDENDNGNIPATPIPTSFAGTMAQDPLATSSLASNGRGIAQLGSIRYVFYIVDASRIRFVSTSGMLSGDAVAQPPLANPVALASDYVFIVAGTSGSGGITRIGRFTVSGSNVSKILVDTNDAGKFTQTNSGTNTSIGLDSANPGRGIVTFKDPNLSVPFTFVFYLSSATSGVIQDQSQSATKGATDVADGSLVAQTGGPFSSSNISGTYALNWSGLSVQQGGTFAIQDEEDLLAQAGIKSLALSGTADIFQFTNGAPRTDFGLGGTITLGGDGTGSGGQRNTMVINLNGANPIDFVAYAASPQLAFFATKDNNNGPQRIVAGILKAQQ